MEYSAGVIPTRNGRYFLIKNTDSQEWGFPKGHLELGETTEQAAHRELYEETGLKAKLITGFEETVSYVMGSNGKEKTVTYFLGAITTEGKATHTHEVCDQGLFTYEEAMERLPHDDAKELLMKAREHLKQENLS